MKMRTSTVACFGFLTCALTGIAARGQQMPDGPDKDLFVKTCSRCHEVERVLSQRQDTAGWQATVAKMQGLGLQADEADLRRIIAFLATNLPAETVSKMNINTATRIEFETTFSFKRSVAAAVIDYREKNGGFKSIDELKKVPGVDADKVDEKKASLTF